MKVINNFIGFLQLCLVVFCCTSCEKYLSIDPPNDKLATETVFSDSTSASLAILGIYSDMAGSNSGFLASQMRWAGFNSDELAFSGSRIEWLQFYENNLSAENGELLLNWNQLYKHIYQANNIIMGVENSANIGTTAKDKLIGEAKFIRGFLFFYLINNWGDVPLILSTDYRENESMPRIAVNEIYDQVSKDLKDAVRALPALYPTSERVRPNKSVAVALLARVQLYQKNWQDAANNASLLISSSEYGPLSTTESCFLKESRETIWQLYPASRYDTYDGYYFVPSSLTNSTIPSYLVSDVLYNSFEVGDKRKTSWIGIKEVGGALYYFPYKYKQRSKTDTEYTVMMRLAEQYLIRAEARANTKDLKGAIADLNVIRNRSGLTDLPENLNQSEVISLVERERRHELFCEWGHRWFDLKRTGRAGEVLKAVKGNHWQDTDMLWPIPLNQLVSNPFLKQNNGY